VTGFDKSISYGVPKDAGKRSFLETVIKNAKEKQAPGQYNAFKEGFTTKPKEIHFPINNQKKISVFAEESKRKEWIPGPTVYSPTRKEKLLGSYKQ